MGHRVQSYDESLRASIENAPQFSPTQGAGELGYLDTNSISHWLKGAGGGAGVCWDRNGHIPQHFWPPPAARETDADPGSGEPASAH